MPLRQCLHTVHRWYWMWSGVNWTTYIQFTTLLQMPTQIKTQTVAWEVCFWIRKSSFSPKCHDQSRPTSWKRRNWKIIENTGNIKWVEQVNRLIAFLRFFRSFIQVLIEHIIPFFKLLEKKSPVSFWNNSRDRKCFRKTQKHHNTNTSTCKTRTLMCHFTWCHLSLERISIIDRKQRQKRQRRYG